MLIEKLSKSTIVKISCKKMDKDNSRTFIKLQTGLVTGTTIRSTDKRRVAQKNLFHKFYIYQIPSFNITKAISCKVCKLTQSFNIFMTITKKNQ